MKHANGKKPKKTPETFAYTCIEYEHLDIDFGKIVVSIQNNDIK